MIIPKQFKKGSTMVVLKRLHNDGTKMVRQWWYEKVSTMMVLKTV